VANFYGALLLFKYLVVCGERNDLKSGTIGQLERPESLSDRKSWNDRKAGKAGKTGTSGIDHCANILTERDKLRSIGEFL